MMVVAKCKQNIRANSRSACGHSLNSAITAGAIFVKRIAWRQLPEKMRKFVSTFDLKAESVS